MASAPRPLRADAERNRRRILDAGREVFADRGLTAGIDAVARCAGVGVGTIYRRFPTKDDLVHAIADDLVDALRRDLEAASAIEDPWEAFAAAAACFTAQAVRNAGFYDALQGDAGGVSISQTIRRAALDVVEPVLRRAQAAGVVRADAEPLDLLALWTNAGRLPRWRREHEPDLWRRYLALVLDGLRPEGAHALPHPPGRDLPAEAGGAGGTRAAG